MSSGSGSRASGCEDDAIDLTASDDDGGAETKEKTKAALAEPSSGGRSAGSASSSKRPRCEEQTHGAPPQRSRTAGAASSSSSSSRGDAAAAASPPTHGPPRVTTTGGLPKKSSPRGGDRDDDGTVSVVPRGNILDGPAAEIIAHQCNCVTTGGNARGLAKAIFARHPRANVYRRRAEHSRPGTIDVARVDGGRVVVALFAQRYPGEPRYGDTKDQRLRWFAESLRRIGDALLGSGDDARFLSGAAPFGGARPITHFFAAAPRGGATRPTVAMPYNIGCGLAGGDWRAYEPLIEDFARRTGLNVKLYDLDNAAAARGRVLRE
mmetsp:Transcript_13196/g.52879  ORF Transcript_13196/g.52879 Transcript_13196/m.52879 type:complete len:322 (-) Transcript_13196:973-1938(-)